MRQYRLHRTSSRRTEAHLQESTTNQLVLRGRHDLLSKPLISVTNYDFLSIAVANLTEASSELQLYADDTIGWRRTRLAV